MRWRLLDEEEAEIRVLMGEMGEQNEDLRVALGVVEMKRGMRPGLRGAGAGEEGEGLPGYGDGGGRGIMGGSLGNGSQTG